MNFVKNYWPGLLILLVTIIIGCTTYQHYGVGWDEYEQRNIGLAYYGYVFENDTNLHHYIERDHGAGFELPLMMIEKGMHLEDTSDIYLMRHLVSHLFFVISMFFGYVLVFKLFNKRSLACLAYLLLVYHPRLYGQSFINSKDIPGMAVTLMSIAAIAYALRHPKLLPWMLCGIVCGYSASIRLMNVIILAPVLFFLFLDILRLPGTGKKLATFGNALVFGLAFCISIYTCWPTLWTNPVKNIIESYQSLSHFRWIGYVLLWGDVINASELPWYYIISWFCITTPVAWLLAGFAGAMLITKDMIKMPVLSFTDSNKRVLLLSLFMFIVPMATVVYLHSVMYDDWRHLYFIYPGFVIMAMYVLNKLIDLKARALTAGILLAQFILIAVFMVSDHPYPHLYFNELVSHKKDALQQRFELDYWGTSVKQGLEWILKDSKAEKITVNDPAVVKNNYFILPADKRNRIVFSPDKEKWNYYIQVFRTYPLEHAPSQSCYDITMQNSTILRIVKVK